MKTNSQQGSRARGLRPLIALVLACAAGAAWAQPRVVVSIPPYADLVARLAGPDAEVLTLLPPGATPHGHEPSPRDLAALSDADLVVMNGAVDAWVEGMTRGAGRQAPTFVAIDALVARGAFAVGGGDVVPEAGTEDAPAHDEHEEHDGHEEPHDAHEDAGHDHGTLGGVDPHVWLDPLLMVELVPALAEALAEVDPERAEAYGAAAEALVADLRALHEELATTLAPAAGAPFVPFHDAWPHFAARYGLDLLLEIEPFPGREPSARELAEAVDAVRASGARAVFTETQLAERPARVLAAEAGVEVVALDPLGGTPGREGYEALLRYNAERIAEALAGE